MMAWLRRSLDQFIGSGEAALTVPAMDGALKPNRILDNTPGIALARPDNLVGGHAGVLCSSGGQVYAVDMRNCSCEPVPELRFESSITAMAVSPEGTLAVALETGEIRLIGERHDGAVIADVEAVPLGCITALCFTAVDEITFCIGSAVNPVCHWQKDLLQRNTAGSVWRLALPSRQATCLASALGYPYGLLPVADGRKIIVSESWKHRLIRLDVERPSTPEVILEDMPGYPARLVSDGQGGAWVAVFAPRNQLVEFVIRETDYRDDMMRMIPADYWIVPALRSRDSFLEPLQGGGVRQMGMLKPWAPTRSYGLVVRLGPDMQPKASLHSRADGHRHGVTSCLATDDRLLVASKGGDEILIHEVGTA